jgi:ADP-dependent phosphofructokinase/glucokinase
LAFTVLPLEVGAGGPARKLSAPRRDIARYADNMRDRGHPIMPGSEKVVARQIRAAEKARARSLDARIDDAMVDALNDRFARAQRLSAPRQNILFGFTRLVDARVRFDHHALTALAERVDPAAFSRYFRRGPHANDTWGEKGVIDEMAELTAALTYHLKFNQGKSLQVSISPSLKQELEGSLAKGNGAGPIPLKRVLGGASAFGANMAAALGHNARFHSAETPSVEQSALFTRRVRVVTKQTGPRGRQAGAVADPTSPTKVNYIIDIPAAETYDIFGERAQAPGEDSRIIVSTRANYPPVFDPRMTRAELRELARQNDILFKVGLHYLSAEPPQQAARTGRLLRTQLRLMRRANPRLYIHYSYVVPKDAAREGELFEYTDGLIDSIDLNAVELTGLCRNLHGARLQGKTVTMPDIVFEDGDPEDPRRVYELAVALQKATGMERVRVHARWMDMVVVKTDAHKPLAHKRMQAEARASHASRALATMKVANESGEIAKASDRWTVLPSLPADGIATVMKLADHLAEKNVLAPSDRRRFVIEGTHVATRSNGLSIAATPAREYHDMTGSKVSAGDTLALGALLEVGHDLLRPAPLKPVVPALLPIDYGVTAGSPALPGGDRSRRLDIGVYLHPAPSR